LKYLLLTMIFTIFSCGNVKDKQYVESKFSKTYDDNEITCMGNSCQNHEDCSCIGADICIPDQASMDSEIGDNINICTIKNCDLNSSGSCPSGWRCYLLPMGNTLFEDAETVCIVDI